MANYDDYKPTPPYLEVAGEQAKPAIHEGGRGSIITPEMKLPITVLRNGIDSAEEELAVIDSDLKKLQESFDRDLNDLLERQRLAQLRVVSYQNAIDILEGSK